MSHIVVQVDQLSKRYRIGAAQQTYTTLRERLGSATQWRKPRSDENILWALRDVSFEVQQGEVLGVIGRNGAGKSTLLKILARITRPTAGQVMIRGRVGSLLEVGTGFHPELTGRENIFLNGAILGMKRAEIRQKFDEIVEFSEIARFIDTPVKRYSSGMFMRLAFAVAAHLEPEILLVDEVLAVGDAAFQKKCLGKMDNIAKEGRTILFVSHNIGAVLALCNRCVLLSNGQVEGVGPTQDVVSHYQSGMYPTLVQDAEGLVDLRTAQRYGTGKGQFTSIKITPLDSDGVPLPFARTGCDLLVDLAIESHSGFSEANAAMIVYDNLGYRLIDVNTALQQSFLSLRPGEGARVRFHLRNMLLKPGNYLLGLWLGRGATEDIDGLTYATTLAVEPDVDSLRHSETFPGVYQVQFEPAVEVVSNDLTALPMDGPPC